MKNTIDRRITHVHIGRTHIYFRAKRFGAVGEFAVLHSFKKVKIFLNGAIAIRRVLSGLRKRASVFTELLRRKIADICLAGFDKLYGILVICVEIIRAVENTAVRRCAEPFKILSYTVYEFIAFFYGVCVVIAKVELSAVFFCGLVVYPDRLCASYMKIAVRLRRKTRVDFKVGIVSQIFIYNIVNKIILYFFYFFHFS